MVLTNFESDRRRGLGGGRETSSRNLMLEEERAGETALRVSSEGREGSEKESKRERAS